MSDAKLWFLTLARAFYVLVIEFVEDFGLMVMVMVIVDKW